MFSSAGKQKKGFTLVEVIVTLTIVAILAAIAIPTGIGYMENAKQTARDKVARSVFLAAQKALTSRMSSGDKLTMYSGIKVETAKIPGFADEANKENIVYLSINQKTQDKNGQELYMLLDPYLTDKEILENTVLIEFNVKTGKVYSAFYSEVDTEIGYGTDGGGKGYDAFKRSKKERKDGRMGYWGVDSTGALDGDEQNVKADIRLVDYDELAGPGDEGKGNNINNGKNYGLLTAECTLPSAGELANIDSITLTLIGKGKESIVIKNNQTAQLPNSITLDEIMLKTDVDSALKDPFKIQEGTVIKNYPMYLETKDDGRRILVWVLDSQAEGMGLYENHKSLGTGTITAEMKFQGQEEQSYEAKPVHGLFSKEYSEQGKTAYGIKSVRHLNNIRYTATDVNKIYVQSNNLVCRDYNDVPIEWEPIGEQGPVRTVASDVEDDKGKYSWGKTHGFFGIYKGEKHTIYDLTISEQAKKPYGMAGLFSCISAKGSVENVELNYSDAYWIEYGLEGKSFICGPDRVGAIAGENWGSISRCTVQGRIYSSGGETKAGGLVGKNMGGGSAADGPGLITQCVAAVDVKAENPKFEKEGALAGGIAGDNYGQITFCESGTASNYTDGRGRIAAEPYFGINTDLSRSSLDTIKARYNGTVVNNVFTVSGTQFAGGIAGQLRASTYGISPKIQYCVNAARVVSDKGSAGGLAGCYLSQFKGKPIRLQWSYNAGDVQGAAIAGGVFGTYKLGMNPHGTDDYNLIRSCYNTGDVRATASNGMAGGVAGTYGQYTEVQDCYSIGVVSSVTSGKADGIVCDRDGTREVKNCAAPDDAPKCWPANKPNGGRLFLNQGQLMNHSFKDLDSKGKPAGPFNYKYPHLTLTKVGDENCGLGDNFHRTEFKDRGNHENQNREE